MKTLGCDPDNSRPSLTLEEYITYLNRQIVDAKQRNLIKQTEYDWLK